MEEIILVGFGGHARSVADCIERQGKYQIIGYTDLEEHHSGYRYLGTDDILADYYNRGVRNAALCIGYMGKGNLRQELYHACTKIGFAFPVIADPSAIISESAEIGEGTFVGKGAIINADAKIGKMCIVNTRALIEHECEIGDFSHISVGSVLCGEVKVGRSVFVGANATVIQCRSIADNCMVGAGMTIRKNVEHE
jgi:sugar O-acyltransferase (sialic acid O-acetyltransferase NeuD family)